jgi:CBS domain-containing protein
VGRPTNRSAPSTAALPWRSWGDDARARKVDTMNDRATLEPVVRGLRARDVMTREIVSVAEDATVRELVGLLQEHEISGAPVVNARGKITGVVSLSDVASVSGEREAIAPEHADPDLYVHDWEDKVNPDELRQLHVEEEGLLVRDIMTPRVYTVAADAPLAEVARTLVSGHVHRLLVAERDRLVGIVSTVDLLRSMAS